MYMCKNTQLVASGQQGEQCCAANCEQGYAGLIVQPWKQCCYSIV